MPKFIITFRGLLSYYIVSTASHQILVTLFCGMFRRGKKLMDNPSHFNVFDVDKMRF